MEVPRRISGPHRDYGDGVMRKGGPIQRKAWLKSKTRLQAKTPIKRSGRIKAKRKHAGIKVGKHTGNIRLYGAALTDLRRQVFEKCGGWCALKTASNCWRSAGWDCGHMHHVIHRSLGGSDTLENCVWACPNCHRKEHGQ